MTVRLTRLLAPIAGIAVFFGLWEGLLRLLSVKQFILPRPSHVVAKMLGDKAFFLREGLITAREALIGLIIALVLALALAVPMARSRTFERAVQPVATLIQVIPIVCYAPAFVIWLHPGNRPIIAVVALIALVPLLFSLVAGLRSADPAIVELLHSVGASRREVLRHVQIPSAIPALLAGLRIAVGLALVGAVLGEWFSLRSHGLGVQIQKAMNTQGGSTLIWASAFALGVIGGVALAALSLAERLLPGSSTATEVSSRGFD
jgi:NitT/TauT family transport system permease protein